MEGKLLYQHLGDERLLCLQVYRPRFLGGKTIPNHYGPLISQKCGSTEIKLRRNLAKLYTARSFDNHDPLTSWANGPFAIRKDRVLRAAEITTGDELQQKYKVEHNFFYSTSLGGLSPTVLDELAKENDLTFVNGVDIESLLGVANSYNPFSLRIKNGKELSMIQRFAQINIIANASKKLRKKSSDRSYQQFERILGDNYDSMSFKPDPSLDTTAALL